MSSDAPDRQDWMTTLALSSVDDLDRHWAALADKPDFAWLKPPEFGAVMVRGRTSGTGAAFNVGEMTVTRCSLQLANGAVGVAYVAGRGKRHAALAAVFDALLQGGDERGVFARRAVDELSARITRRRRREIAKAYTSKVDFFMLTREEEDHDQVGS